LAGLDLGLHENDTGRAGGSYTIESRKLYLEAGRYRLKTSLEGQLIWSSFSLPPRTVQRRLLSTLDALHIGARQGVGAPQPLQIRLSVFDAGSGEDLTAGSALMVYVRGVWLPWNPIGPPLMTGETYRFRVQREGYYPLEYALIVKPFQSSLSLEARLVPHPGTLLLRSTADGLSLRLNGSDFYPAGGEAGGFKRLEPLGAATRQLILPPGDYLLSVRRDVSEGSLRFHLGPDDAAAVDIGFDKKTGALNVTLGE
jgi:hypothetical protein